jgi:hypothetical protein
VFLLARSLYCIEHSRIESSEERVDVFDVRARAFFSVRLNGAWDIRLGAKIGDLHAKDSHSFRKRLMSIGELVVKFVPTAGPRTLCQAAHFVFRH